VFDVRNNVMYDWGKLCSGWTGDHLSVNYVNNYIRPGPSSNLGNGIIALLDTAAVSYFLSGNVVDGHRDWSADNRLLFNKAEANGHKLYTVVDQAFDAPAVTTTSAEQALRDVLAGAGCTLPRRDAVDARIVREVETRTGKVIDSQEQVGGWPEYRGKRP
jgi:hypothetical protein